MATGDTHTQTNRHPQIYRPAGLTSPSTINLYLVFSGCIPRGGRGTTEDSALEIDNTRSSRNLGRRHPFPLLLLHIKVLG